MGETTKVGRDYIRQCLEAGWELVWLIRPGEYGYFDDAPALLADADRCEELEGMTEHAYDTSCIYCGWSSPPCKDQPESVRLYHEHATSCDKSPLREIEQHIAELEAEAADWRQQYLDSCASRDAAIDRLKAEVHQRDEWLERAKARYEIQAKENARILEDYVATVSGLRGHVERLEDKPSFECWNCGKMNCKTGVCMDCWHSDNPELDAAKAENERLRAGIGDIAERLPGWTDHDGSTPEGELLKLATEGS